MNGESGHVAPGELALTGVDTGADLKAELSETVANRSGAFDGAARRLKRRQEPISGGLNLPPSVQLELAAKQGIVLVEKLAPPGISQLLRTLGRKSGKEHKVALPYWLD